MAQPGEDSRKLIRKALNHLYNPDFLRRSRLISLLGLAERFDAPKVLQRILLQAIETVQYRPAGSRDERRAYYHDLLRDRYVTKLSQEKAAAKLDISLRQLAREQDHAIDILATVLAEKYPALASTLSQQPPTNQIQPDAALVDLSRFAAAIPAVPLRLAYWLENITDLITPLAHQKQVAIEIQLAPDVVGVLVHPVALRQALLAILHNALKDTGTRKITLSAENAGLQVQIGVRAEGSANGKGILAQSDGEIVSRLIEVNGGQMGWSETSDGLLATLLLPGYQKSLVLVLDDDPGFLHFLQQITQGNRYQIVSLSEPILALEWAVRYAVDCIILDVMSPGFDGWRLLMQLHQHPQVRQIPVVVCTLIVLDEIVDTLGARTILRKPVTKATLLSTLDQWVERDQEGLSVG